MASSSVLSWKQEPASPLLGFEQDSWSNASDNVVLDVELTDDKAQVSRAEQASKMLQDLDQWTKEEDPFPDWLEEKIDLPIFDDLPSPPLMNNMEMAAMKLQSSSVDMVPIPVKTSTPLNHQNMDMISLKNTMMNNGMDVVGLKPEPQNLLALNPQILQYPVPVCPPPPTMPVEQTSILMPEFDYPLNTHNTLTPPESPRDTDLVFTMLQEMQPHELDELVRMRVESLESPSNCIDSSRSSMHEESDSVASPSSDSGYSDPEWSLPASSDLKAPKKRRVTKPYSRTPPEEKRLRKKEQNKNAATRYRLKKKQEIEEILDEEKQLQQKNEQFKSELTEVGREIKYLKNLMRDMFRAKGLIK